MILYRSIIITYLDKIGRERKLQIPFNSAAREKLAELYNNRSIVVLSVVGIDPEYEDSERRFL